MSAHHFVTGIAGFIGSHLADSLLADGCRVSGVDDYSLGIRGNLSQALHCEHFHVEEADIRGLDALLHAMQIATARFGPISTVWHLAANSDISAGIDDASIDFGRTLKTSFCVVEACKSLGINEVAFASTSAVYGEHSQVIEEQTGPLLPISTYGATKLASEALLSAAAEVYLEKIWIYRFPNVVGSRATHGALHDFVKRLKEDPSKLDVLGNGHQCKPYLHVSELIEAMRHIQINSKDKRNLFNIGPNGDGTTVRFLAEQTVARAAPHAQINYGSADRGWVGDVPRFSYSTAKLARLGWQPKMSSDEAVKLAIAEITAERGI